jgi:predicted dehydrogenase
MKTFGCGLIGSGFMGKRHAHAMRNAPRNFALAVAAGRTVWCQKPLATAPADAKEMEDAATSASVQTIVGFATFAIRWLAREIVASGEIGEPVGFRGVPLA